MSELKKANSAMREGRYKEALEIYRKIAAADGFLASIAKNNIDLISAKYVEAAESSKLKIYLKDIYDEVAQKVPNDIDLGRHPLVSIIVTAHNTEEYLEACLESLLSQTYKNIEIYVVDDFSSDKTSDIVKRLKRVNKKIHYKKLNANLGTYYAKNLGIKESRGEVIVFQDSDDISHPRRVEVLVSLLGDSSKKIARGSYSRVDPDTDEVLAVNGLYKKLGLITLAVRREVFEKIGFFNCTTKASDDEFYNRAVKFLGKNVIVNNELPLYYNTYREGSLFADMVTRNADGAIQQKPSESRAEYVVNFRKIHDSSSVEQIKRIFRFPRIRDAVVVRSDMTKLSNPRDKVIFNVCSIPQRAEAFRKTINSIIDQCDLINVYLDGYENVPEFISKHSDKINVYRSQEIEGLRDGGKFIFLEKLVNSGERGYYFTIDDDIIYPADYSNALIKYIDQYNKKCVFGVHGVLLKDTPVGYFSDKRVVYNFTRSLEALKTVNIIGTGTMAFHSEVFDAFSISEFEKPGMTDIYFGRLCKRKNIPMVVIPREDDWLIDMNPSPEQTLYHEFKGKDRDQTEILVNSLPWGLQAINSCISYLSKDNEIISNKLKDCTIKLSSLTR